jgi:ADP-dependent NAD(P)H-hydrate dehydratase / NAD(P)H-hydrate epimerase
MKLVTVAEMQAIEREADQAGWSYAQMMKAAGQGLADIVHSFYGYEEKPVVTGLVGSGNNGGDTLIALADLAQNGWQARAYLVRPRTEDDDLLRSLILAGGELLSAEQDQDLVHLDDWLADSTVLLDGVLGTGFRLPLKAGVGRILARVKTVENDLWVVAVDCPSGVDCDSGQAAEEAIPADLTVCMAAVKVGLLKFPAFGLLGELETVDIGLPPGLSAWQSVQTSVLGEEHVRSLLPERKPDSHKGTYGTVGVVAGSVNYTGAALLAGRAAHRIGAGLVQIALPAPLHAALAGHFPEATWVLLPHEMGVIAEGAVEVLAHHLQKVDVLLWGPGFGLEDPTAAFVRRLVEGHPSRGRRGTIGFVSAQAGAGEGDGLILPPMVIDADGLKLLARVVDWPQRLPPDAVLTPHPGEMAILSGLALAEIQADRLGTAQRFAREWGHVVVLKGAMTVIAEPGGQACIVPVASSALAHAGTGDVLAGLIAGLRAQGLSAYDAAAAGAWLHAQSGLLAVEQVGHEAAVLASDLITALPDVLAWLW